MTINIKKKKKHRIHDPPQRYQCPLCKRKFSAKHSRNRHMENIHQEDPNNFYVSSPNIKDFYSPFKKMSLNQKQV